MRVISSSPTPNNFSNKKRMARRLFPSRQQARPARAAMLLDRYDADAKKVSVFFIIYPLRQVRRSALPHRRYAAIVRALVRRPALLPTPSFQFLCSFLPFPNFELKIAAVQCLVDGTGGVIHLYGRNLSAVCERLVGRGHEVTAVSSRGENPRPDSEELSRVRASSRSRVVKSERPFSDSRRMRKERVFGVSSPHDADRLSLRRDDSPIRAGE